MLPFPLALFSLGAIWILKIASVMSLALFCCLPHTSPDTWEPSSSHCPGRVDTWDQMRVNQDRKKKSRLKFSPVTLDQLLKMSACSVLVKEGKRLRLGLNGACLPCTRPWLKVYFTGLREIHRSA